MAIVLAHHVHRRSAKAWWDESKGRIAFTRLTQISLLRLLTTAAAMDGKPLGMDQAWAVYDALFADDRVTVFAEPAGVQEAFRAHTAGGFAAPKFFADAWLMAVAGSSGGTLITFDRALASRAKGCLLLGADRQAR